MKLKNKLLPLIGTAAIVATATPLALTSCKSNNYEIVDITDGTKAIPTIAPMESLTWMGQSEYTTAYVKACKENPEIFKQDFIYGMYKYNIMQKSDSVTYKYLKVGCSNPTFGVANVSYPGEPDVQYPTISFSYTIQFSRESNNYMSSSYMNIDTTKDLTVTLKNVPFTIKGYNSRWGGTDTKNFWFDLPSESYIWKFNLNSWSIDYSYTENQTETFVTQSGKNVTENNTADSGTLKYGDVLEYKDILPLNFGFDSYHLSAIDYAPEFIPHKVYAGLNTKEGAVPGSLSDGMKIIPHQYMRGLYIPSQTKFGLIKTADLSVSVFAGYDADGEMIPLTLTQLLPETSQAKPVYIEIPVAPQAYQTTNPGDGWAAADTVYYDTYTQYIAYQFPEAKFVNALGVETVLMPTIKEAGIEAFTFALPKSIMIQFSYPNELDPENPITWDQEVWLSQEEMTLYGYFTAA